MYQILLLQMLHGFLHEHVLLCWTVCLSGPATASSTEHTAENISKDISHITTEVKTAKSAAIKSASTLLKGSMTILVILRFLSESLNIS